MGRGLLAGTDAPPLGTYLGVAGAPEITELVEQSDALFLLGVIISDTNFGVSARQIDLRTHDPGARRRGDARLSHLRRASRSRRWSTRCSSGCQPRPCAAPRRRRALSARPARRRRRDRARRHRPRGQRPDGRARAHADRHRRRRLPVHGDGHRPHGAGRARLLRDDGLRRAGGPRPAGRDRRAAADPGRRRRVPDDRLGARQLPPLRLGSDRDRVQQRELGDAAHVPAGVAVQRPRRMELRRHRVRAGRRRRARAHAPRAGGGARRAPWRRAAASS